MFVIIDEVQFTKGSYCNRLKFKTYQGEPAWLTVPVSYSLGDSFLEVNIKDQKTFVERASRILQGSYAKALNFRTINREILEILQKEYDSIAALNVELIQWVCSKLNITTEIKRQSEIGKQFGKSNELTRGLTAHFGGDIYLSGQGAKKYNRPELFEEKGIELVYQEYSVQDYDQLHGEFIGGLSVLDALFNLPVSKVESLVKC